MKSADTELVYIKGTRIARLQNGRRPETISSPNHGHKIMRFVTEQCIHLNTKQESV